MCVYDAASFEAASAAGTKGSCRSAERSASFAFVGISLRITLMDVIVAVSTNEPRDVTFRDSLVRRKLPSSQENSLFYYSINKSE